MKIYLSDGTVKEPKEIEGSWLISEVNKHGDLTVYRTNEYVLSPSAVMHFAAGIWCYTE